MTLKFLNIQDLWIIITFENETAYFLNTVFVNQLCSFTLRLYVYYAGNGVDMEIFRWQCVSHSVVSSSL